MALEGTMTDEELAGRFAQVREYPNCREPFAALFNAITSRDSGALVAMVKENEPRTMGTFPTVLLHPDVDPSYVLKVLEKESLKGILAYLARAAVEFAEKDTPPPQKFLRTGFEKFNTYFRGGRKAELERIAEGERHSPFSREDPRNFRHDVYRSKLYFYFKS